VMTVGSELVVKREEATGWMVGLPARNTVAQGPFSRSREAITKVSVQQNACVSNGPRTDRN